MLIYLSMNNEIRLLAELVAMPTITDNIEANTKALDYLESFFKPLGMHCQRHVYDGRGSLTISTRPDNHKNPKVMLSGHTDVAPGAEDMFQLKQKDGKLIGRGVYDMKFSLAGFMQLAQELSNEGVLQDCDFGLLITSDEETAGLGVSHLINAGFRSEVALLPDSTAAGWNIEAVAKGWWRFELIAKGKSAHSSRPWEGESASEKLIHALHELRNHFEHQGPATDSINIGNIHGEGEFNKIPDHMVAKVEIRLVDDDSYDKNEQLVKELCAKHGIEYATHSASAKPLRPILNSPLVDTYKDIVQKITGRRPEDYISLGASDASYFTKAGIPCIVSCPLGGGHHSDNEWIDQASFEQFVPILREFLDRTARFDQTE